MSKCFLSVATGNILTDKEVSTLQLAQISSHRSKKISGVTHYFIGYDNDSVEVEVSSRLYTKLAEIDLLILVNKTDEDDIVAIFSTVSNIYKGAVPDTAPVSNEEVLNLEQDEDEDIPTSVDKSKPKKKGRLKKVLESGMKIFS